MRVLLALAVVLPLAGCASTPAASVRDPRIVVIVERGRPSAAPTPRFEPSAAWLDGGARLELVTWGSSTCPDVPIDASATEDGLVLRLREYDGMCTQDLAPYRVVLERPGGVDPSRPQTVRLVHGHGRDDVLRLAAAAD